MADELEDGHVVSQDELASAGNGAAQRALARAYSGSLHDSLVARASERIKAKGVGDCFFSAAPGATVAECQFVPSSTVSQRRLEALRASDRQLATRNGTVPVKPGDYALTIRAGDKLQLSGIHAGASIAEDAMKSIFLPLAGVGIFGGSLLSLSNYGSGAEALLLSVVPTVLLLATAMYYLLVIRRGAVTGTFLKSLYVGNLGSANVADIRRSYVHARDSIEALKRSSAWRSETLAGPRVQINLDEEATQLAEFALALEKLHLTLGDRPVQLGDGALSLWDSRNQIYQSGVASLRQRAEAIVALRLAVDDVEMRLSQLDKLQSADADDLAAQVVRAMPANELATAHTQNLTANAAGVAQALRDELTMLTASADELARATAQLSQHGTDERTQN